MKFSNQFNVITNLNNNYLFFGVKNSILAA